MNDTFQDIIDAVIKNENHHAENLCWSALKSNPNSSKLYKWLGIALLKQKKYDGALEALLKSLPENEGDYDVLNNLAFVYRHLEDYKKAQEYCDKADKIKPHTYGVTFNRAQIAMELKKYDVAKKLTIECFDFIKNAPQDGLASIRNLKRFYVDILLAQRNVEESVRYMKESLEEEFDARIFFDLANISPSDVNDNIFKLAETYASQEQNHFLLKASALFGIGRIYEKNKNYESAFKKYSEANLIKSKMLRFKPFSGQEYLKQSFKFFTHETFKKYNFINRDKGKECIFILGNPRSGTTLVESIVGSSDKVVSAGELNSFLRISEKVAYKNFTNIDKINLDELGNNYLRILKIFSENNSSKFIIDKMPANIMNVGVIRLLLPAAKIICLNRRPLDNAWSLFTQLYLGNIPYSSNLFNMGIAMANVEAAKKFWQSQNIDKNFMIIDYEKVVEDPKNNSGLLFDFIGIEADYDEGKRKKFYSRTASRTQVQKDIYTSSISRSKEYDKFMGEFQKSFDNQNLYWDGIFKSQKNQ
ncbi:MAG: hypothetical protein CMI90_02970 [Pelagibacteraceae bacterium]|nr:hypothetical protein [Pelagibacteraceae bacterium]